MSSMRSEYVASDPRQVAYKLKECQYQFEEMKEHDKAGDVEKFKHSLSAFLVSFRSIGYRLIGVSKNNAVKKQLLASPIAFLFDKANLEVHGDGPTIWKRYNIQISDSMQDRWPPRWHRDDERWPPRFESRFHSVVRTQTIIGADWQFSGDNQNLLELCRQGLDEMEKAVQQNLP